MAAITRKISFPDTLPVCTGNSTIGNTRWSILLDACPEHIHKTGKSLCLQKGGSPVEGGSRYWRFAMMSNAGIAAVIK
jgi:hypothetical protein